MSQPPHLPEIIRPAITRPPELAAGQIHLYILSINDLPVDKAMLDTCLHEEEKARAARFIHPQHGEAFRRVRGMLRVLLASYLEAAPSSLHFEYAEHGKPALQAHTGLQFNLSHSGDMAAYAVRRDAEVGVDIEYMRPQRDLAGMIRHVASTAEQSELAALAEALRPAAFYRLWTRKEAFIKACGRGLGMGLGSIHIGVSETASPLPVEYKEQVLPEWFVQDINPPSDYKVAVCSKRLDA